MDRLCNVYIYIYKLQPDFHIPRAYFNNEYNMVKAIFAHIQSCLAHVPSIGF
jgi:hypothetical protein